jgi:hypothetical protein
VCGPGRWSRSRALADAGQIEQAEQAACAIDDP